MEQFSLLTGDQTLKSSREPINNALLTLRSLSSGTTFPTTNLSVGMLCYRTDHAKLYQLTDATNQTWTDTIAMNITGSSASANSILWANIQNTPATYPPTAHTHPYAGSATAGGAATSAVKLATARTINGVSFDGTGDITIVNSIAQGGTGASTAEEARANLGINSVPTGTIIAYAANSAPDGYLLCNGAAVSRTTYATLFGKIGTTYGTGDGSTTFALPNLTDKFLQGSATAGTAKAAGLPNITGTMWDIMSTVATGMGNGSGAFQTRAGVAGVYNSSTGTQHPGDNDGMTFDASRSSSIYGKSTTVQPPALTTRFYIKY